MANELKGKRIAFLATDGVEQIEYTAPWDAVQAAGGQAELVSLQEGEIRGFNHLQPGDRFTVHRTVQSTQARDFDGLVVPGGVANPDFLRMDADAVRFVREFFEQSKPVAAICHGPWLLVEAGVVKGRTLTSFPSLRTDIENAGGHWVDREVCVDAGLTTSRKPDDLNAFCAKAVEEFAEGEHARQMA
ncbi:MAG: type 1 glutamine amidotransferase domain-containing protein [Halofilum sp. (in: g-proteobacteria)]